jgi:hypothetical protein
MAKGAHAVKVLCKHSAGADKTSINSFQKHCGTVSTLTSWTSMCLRNTSRENGQAYHVRSKVSSEDRSEKEFS